MLRSQLSQEAIEPVQAVALGEVAQAELAARAGDGPQALKHLASAGKWAFDVATKIGAAVAAYAIKNAMGL